MTPTPDKLISQAELISWLEGYKDAVKNFEEYDNAVIVVDAIIEYVKSKTTGPVIYKERFGPKMPSTSGSHTVEVSPCGDYTVSAAASSDAHTCPKCKILREIPFGYSGAFKCLCGCEFLV